MTLFYIYVLYFSRKSEETTIDKVGEAPQKLDLLGKFEWVNYDTIHGSDNHNSRLYVPYISHCN